MIETERDGVLEAVVWFTDLWEDVIECHAAARPDVRGRWLSRDLYATIHDTIIAERQPTAVVAQIYSPNVERLWRRLGFDIYPNIAILDLKE